MRPGTRTLLHLMEPMAAALAQPGTTEVVVNQPGRFGVECDGRWTWHDAPALTFEHLDAIGILAAAMTSQDLGEDAPSCSSRLPNGERITIVRPPVMPPDIVSLTIRKRATSFTPTLQWLAERGFFSFLDPAVDWVRFFGNAVRQRRTIVIAAETGAGKTTLAEALIREIPLHERLVTLESTPEWIGLPHENWVPLIYAREGSTTAGMRGPVECLEDTLRMRPDRILMGELRTGEAWAYLRALMAGHPGGITTCHAETAEGAFDALAMMIRQSPGQTIAHADIMGLLRKHIHLAVHCAKVPGDAVPYRVTEVVEVGRMREAA